MQDRVRKVHVDSRLHCGHVMRFTHTVAMGPSMRAILHSSSWLFVVLALGTTIGCEAEVGMPCNNNPDVVDDLTSREPGTNVMVQNLSFENCSQLYCLSADGSRPFCTKRCQSALDCSGNTGEEWTCEQVVAFGQHACEDWTPERDCFQEDGVTPSDQPIRYCTTTAGTIAERDEQYGRDL